MIKKITTLVFSTIVITGCSSLESQESKQDQPPNKSEQVQPKLEYTMGSNDWSVVTDLTDNPKILEAYQFAVEHPEVLDHMPCYCGCYEEDGHTSNTNCFVDSVQGDVALLDTMGFG